MKNQHLIIFFTFTLSFTTNFVFSENKSSSSANIDFPSLPAPTWKHSAAVIDDWLYLYGGTTGGFRDYSIDHQHADLWRVNLEKKGKWEKLLTDKYLESAAIVNHKGYIYFIGGLSASNKKDEPMNVSSVADVKRYDPKSNKLESLTPLPEPRSSHGATIIDDKLYVVGGWQIKDRPGRTNVWRKETYVCDLNEPVLKWTRITDSPFTRQGFATVSADGKLYCIGGIADRFQFSNEVDVYNSADKTWSKGPNYPVSVEYKGTGVGAITIGQYIYANGFGGGLYRFDTTIQQWEETDFELRETRVYHQLKTHNDKLLFIGGRSGESVLDTIETADLNTVKKKQQVEIEEIDINTYLKNYVDNQPGSKTWPGLNGGGSSQTNAKTLPVRWSDNENITWRKKIQGYGQSSPIVWNSNVFITSIEGQAFKTKRIVSCYDLVSGDINWSKIFDTKPNIHSSRQKAPNLVSRAAPTPVVDKDRLYVFFETGELAAFTHEGEQLWMRNLVDEYGPYICTHGLGSSLTASDDAIILLIVHDGPSYMLSVNKITGNNNWKIERPSGQSYSTPGLSSSADDGEIIISTPGKVEAFNAKDGSPKWVLAGLKGNKTPSPAITKDLIIIGGDSKNDNLAIRRGGNGDLSKSHIAWYAETKPSGFGSPLVVNDKVYFSNKAGIAYCVRLDNGKLIWKQRMPNANWATPIAAADRIYFFGNAGTTIIYKSDADKAVKISENSISVETTKVYGAAAVDGAFIIRTGTDLICIGNPSI